MTQREGPPSRVSVALALAISAEPGSNTPRGSPIDPEVATTTATSSSSSGALGSSGRTAARMRSTYSGGPAGNGAIAGPSPLRAAGNSAARPRTPSGPGSTVNRVNSRAAIGR